MIKNKLFEECLKNVDSKIKEEVRRNMEKTRVPKGEKYWHILIFSGLIEIEWLIEENLSEDESNFEMGNYFYTEEEAEIIVNKFRAILKGTDVTEMLSEDEIIDEAKRRYPPYMHKGNMQDSRCGIFWKGVKWLKEKIIK